MKTIKNQIRELEEKLLHEDVRSNPEILIELLADDFEEIGVSGKIISRQEVIDWLVNKERDIQWSLDNFRVKELSPNVVFSLYEAKKKDISKNTTRGSMRSSIWKLHGKQWKMIFHQGTQVKSENNI